VASLTAISAARAIGTGFAATEYETDALPCPLVFATDTQEALVLTVHVQSGVVAMATVPLPPSDVKSVVVGEPT
jgi:predicted FMN-binding regulatory protein PaiB